MASSRAQILLRLQQMPRGAPLGSPELKNIGVSAPLAYQYVKRGWLNKLGRGVFTLPADELQRDTTLKFLARQMPGLHAGGKTALAWRGVRHNIAARERLSLWGVNPGKLPQWFSWNKSNPGHQLFFRALEYLLGILMLRRGCSH